MRTRTEDAVTAMHPIMRGRKVLILLSLLGLVGCHSVSEPDPIVLDSGGALIREQAAFDVRHVDLAVSLDPRRKFLDGSVSLEVEIVDPISWLVLDLDPPLRVHVARRWSPEAPDEEKRLDFERRGSRIWVHLGEVVPVGRIVVVEIGYSGVPREASQPPWGGGFTWSETPDGQPWITTTVQGEGADLWWPCKDHPSDKPDSFTLRVTVPEPLVVAANGKLVEVLENGDGTRTYHWHSSVPISCYNVALNIAPYRTIEGEFESVAGTMVPVTYWVLPQNYEKGQKLFLEILEHLAFYERYLGPYPFRSEKYGVAETPHLGMEHQTIIAYGNKYKGGPHGYDWLHHHELGHEWWGNLVTARDWRHFWIHEGFCTYMQALYAEEREGPMAYHHAMYTSRGRFSSKHPLVPRAPTGMVHIKKTVGNDVYFKGSWILHTLRYLIGDEAFFLCLRRMAYPSPEWESRGDGSACRSVTTEDFVALVEEVTGESHDWFFKLYLYQPELPELVSQIEGEELRLKWKTPDGYPFPMPVEIRVGDKLERVPMPGGKTTLNATTYGSGLLDPNRWILKKKRLIQIGDPTSPSASPRP